MKVVFSLFLPTLLNFTFCCLGMQFQVTCDSPQYIEIGQTGTINCIFHDKNYFGIFWYNTSDYSRNDPVLHYQNFVKSGVGYTAGEFDIHPNGSLIINDATLQHDTTFTVAYVPSPSEKPILVNILVVIIVRPKPQFPCIDFCGNFSQVCYYQVDIPFLQCSVSRARPKVTLNLMIRTVKGDIQLSTNDVITPDGVGYTSSVTTRDLFHHSSLLTLLVCKANSPPGMLVTDESLILVQNGRMPVSLEGKIVTYIERYMQMELSCSTSDVGFMVWKKAITSDRTVQEVLMYSVLIGEPFTRTYVDDITMEANGSLRIPQLEVKHEGLYFCLFGNGSWDGLTSYEVVMIVYPVPAYPVIEGCNEHQSCVLEGKHKSSLTCTVMKIRPLVDLEWKATYDSDPTVITFTNQRQTVKNNGDTFDVSLMTMYEVVDVSRERVAIECVVSASHTPMLDMTSKVDLVIKKDEGVNTTQQFIPRAKSNIPWIVVTAVFLLVLALLVSIVVFKKCIGHFRARSQETSKATKEQTQTEETIKMIPETLTGSKKERFIKELKGTYKNVYSTVHPIPFRSETIRSIDSEFVEDVIEFIDTKEDVHNIEEWKRLTSYQGVFNDPQVKSRTRILEGEPGYGKTILTYKFAYDWYSCASESALTDVEILICLPLRKLQGIISIYRAIKQFLLPIDTKLTETDIKTILEGSKKVTLILDGFDEYPHQLGDSTFHILNIIAGEMFQDYEVLLTTRKSVLPKKYPPQTQRFRLTGFSENVRKHYIRQAITGRNKEAEEKIERQIKENPILNDLCQVPLIFVIIAHMASKREEFQQLYSATSFFRYVISSFFSHTERKMEDKNALQFELNQNDHSKLDEVAFEALSDKERSLVWDKTDLCNRIGEDVYKQYNTIGILIEERDIYINDDPCSPIAEHIQYKTKVTFFHKLFCEWYAAHHLAHYIEQNPSADISKLLQHLEPTDVHYLYRFTCGLSLASEELIVDFLMKKDDCDQFAILCILEQKGKIHSIKDTLRQLCFEGVIISIYDSLLLQRSTMLLLEIASKEKIPIEYVCLHNCFNSVNESRTAIITNSQLSFSNTVAVKWLIIELSNKHMTARNARHILKYASNCDALKILQFSGCVPPWSFKAGDTLTALESKKIQVRWVKYADSEPYILNLQSGKWERMTDRTQVKRVEFKVTKMRNIDIRKMMREEDYKKMVKKTRDEIREWGLKYSPKKNEMESQ